MQVPLEITFHNMESLDWAEQEIRARVDDLESIYDRLTSCRVRVDQRATNNNDTIPPVVRIELGIPGRKDLVVAHEPDRLQRVERAPLRARQPEHDSHVLARPLVVQQARRFSRAGHPYDRRHCRR